MGVFYTKNNAWVHWFDKHFVKNTRKKTWEGNIFHFFLLDTLKTTFWIETLIQWWAQSRPFFPKIRTLSSICLFKCYTEFWICLNMSQNASIMLEYALMYVNMAEYCWMSLNLSTNTWVNCSDYATVLNMSHHLRYLIGFSICLSR